MSQIIGKVGMTPRGMYERTRAYERLDVVTYQGSSWVAIVDVPAQISPALGSDYWQLQARMGETGPQGPVGPQGNSAFDGTGVELVNNLTQGGQTAALSAEQGKILKQELTELESEVSQIYDAEYSLSDFDDLKAINVNGEVISNEYFRTLTNIPVSEGDVVECVGIKSDNPNYCSIAAYNKLGQFESSSSVFAQYSDSYRYIVPSGIVLLRLSTLRGVANVGVTIRRPTALTTILESISEKGVYQTNGEYIRAYTDKDGYVLWGIRGDGSIEFSKGVPSAIKEWGKTAIALTENYYSIEDAEGRIAILLDSEGKVISSRDADGRLRENGIDVNSLEVHNIRLSTEASEQVASALKRIGFNPSTPTDYSNSENIELPIPRIAASVRLIVPRMPTSKTDDIEGYLEYNDKDGNYFKKAIVVNSQGSSSMDYIKPDGSQGNLSIDFADCKVKFGKWVSQDSFHIKKYYIDAFRGQCVVGYHLMEQVYQTRPFGEKKPFETMFTNNSVSDGLGKFKQDFDTGALCHPDGFPVVVYVNTGEEDLFYGVYAWCLKKHRDNYYCEKANPNNIILDGVINSDTLWGGDVKWEQFEVRNPKDLIDKDGNEYDGDNPTELSDTDELSASVKANIVAFSKVNAAMAESNTRETFEQFFLVESYIDYYLVSQVIYNIDGLSKNWIWCTWDGKHWTPTLYDVDSIFGMMPIGTFVNADSANSEILSVFYLPQLYATEIRARYKELRDNGVFSVANITELLNSWLERIGYDNLKADLEKFNETPSYRSSYLANEWEVLSYSWDSTKNTYESSKIYSVGDTCYYYGYLVRARRQVENIAPFSQVYDRHPQANGFYNSIKRVQNWLTSRIQFLDEVYGYSLN